MSLQVWLPLNGDLHNQGLSNYNISMLRGSAIFDDNGKIGKCFYANGVNTIKIENIISDFYNYPGYSLCAWFYIEAQNTIHSGSGIISAGNWNNQILNLALSGWSTDHYTQLQVSGTSWNKIYNYTFNKNTWYHVVVSSDGSKTYAYVNGTLIGDTLPGFLPTTIEGNNIAIGGATYYGGMQFFGKINDVRIYDHCLSDKEVEEIARGLVLHYKLDNIIDNNIYDCSGYGNNGTATSVTLSNASARYDNNAIFSGSTSYIKVTDNKWMAQHASAMTINLWAKASSWVAGSHFFSCTEGGGFNTEAGNSGYLRFPIYVCTNETQTSYAYKYDSQELQLSALPTNEWVMLTFIYDSTGTRIYINGQLHHTYTNTSYGIRFNTSARLFLGCEASGANAASPWFKGEESDFRIYYTALTEEQIQELYQTSMTIDNKGNGYAREVIEDSQLNITKTGQFHGNEMLDDNNFTTASITKTDKQLKVNTLYEY